MAAGKVAFLEHLTGPSSGELTWVDDRQLCVGLRPSGILTVSAIEAPVDDGERVARLRQVGDAYEIEVEGDSRVWVNGTPIQRKRLAHHDMIEFGERGPLSRLFVYQSDKDLQPGVGRIFGDALAYMKSSRRPLGARLSTAARQISWRLARRTTLLFRIAVIVALIALGIIVYQQARISALHRKQLEFSLLQMESFSKLLSTARQESISPTELAQMRQELEGQMSTTARRLTELERLSTARERVIVEARPSIFFLQGAYGFKDQKTARMLRQALGPDSRPLMLPSGVPLLTLEGDGPVAERHFTGTGFLLAESDYVATSRHVGQPWLYDVQSSILIDRGLVPVLTRFVAFAPGQSKATNVSLRGGSEEADLAILSLDNRPSGVLGLRLSAGPPTAGEEIILLGYPTGIRAMLAQAGLKFVERLQQENITDLWSVTAELAQSARIVPLASGGIVGQVSHGAIVYDAETTYGGSGGPVLNAQGEVVAINSAILPEYGGSNMGVPVRALKKLIAKVEAQN